MKMLVTALGLATVLIAVPLTAVGSQEGGLELEPCINGSVSASGLYANQVLEDAAKAGVTQVLQTRE
jgi:hypothetical protein